jgi:hypothetical protein
VRRGTPPRSPSSLRKIISLTPEDAATHPFVTPTRRDNTRTVGHIGSESKSPRIAPNAQLGLKRKSYSLRRYRHGQH